MIQYIYFVKCPNCEDEHFDFFDDAKAFALSCLGDKPVITQVEVCRNDFGECTDSVDHGVQWSWEDEVDVADEEPAVNVFTKGDFAEYNPDNDPEFDALDNSVNFDLDSVPDNFRKPVKENITGNYIGTYDYNRMSKEELYNHIVTKGNTVEIEVGDQENYEARFKDGGVYSDSVIEVKRRANGLFTIVMWNYSDDGDVSEDIDYDFSTDSFDELWEEIMSFSPTALHEASQDNKVLKATRAPRDSDYVIVSKHANGSYSFFGNNYRMTKQLDNAMTYAGKADAEYDIKYAEDQSEASSISGDRYSYEPFFAITFSEAKKLVDDYNARVKERNAQVAARQSLNAEVRDLARKMYDQGNPCNSYDEFVTFMLDNGYDKPTKHLYYSTYRNELMCYKKELEASKSEDEVSESCERKPIPAGMTIEQLVEEMEENEDTVECTWCNDLFDKSECRYEVNLGWLCSRCEAAIKSRGETLTFRENNYWDFLDEDVPAESSSDETVELFYNELTKTIAGPKRDADDWDEIEYSDNYTFTVSRDDVAVAIWDHFITEEDVTDVPGGLDTLEDDKEWEKFLETHFDTLFEKYYDKLLEYFKDDAVDAFESGLDYEYSDYLSDLEADKADREYDDRNN